jgi:hypothetical protein
VKGCAVVRVINHPSAFELRWCCKICHERCSLESLWLAFAPGNAVEAQEAQWVHRSCVEGRVAAVFGSKRITLMRGYEALKQLATSLHDVTTDPAMRRQQPGPAAKARPDHPRRQR